MTGPRRAGGQFRAALALAACCLLTPALAVQYLPVPVSTLVSKRDLQFKQSHEQRGAERVTLLVHQPAGADVVPVASITETHAGEDVRVAVRLLDGANRADLRLATLENLYVLLLRREATARYSFGDRQGMSQADVLAELAAVRDRAKPAVSWQVVSMSSAPAKGTDEDDVAVRVFNDRKPMQGVTVFFNRAPHHSCLAKTSEDGVAACRLVDQHGDGHLHKDEHGVPVVVTFPGDVQPDRVLVPITLVMRPQ